MKHTLIAEQNTEDSSAGLILAKSTSVGECFFTILLKYFPIDLLSLRYLTTRFNPHIKYKISFWRSSLIPEFWFTNNQNISIYSLRDNLDQNVKETNKKYVKTYLSSLCRLLLYFRNVLFMLGWFSNRLMKTLIPTSTSCCSTECQLSLMLVTSKGLRLMRGISFPVLLLSPPE